jgi:broad specificity phosphatase PhoE
VPRLVLVRHGESEWNVARRIQGQAGPGLTSRGEEQAERTALVVADAYPDAYLASSDLARCEETARPLMRELGIEPVYDRGLRERDFGSWTGRLGSEVAETEGDRWLRWRDGHDVVAEVGGEDSPTLVARVLTAAQRLLDEASGRPLVCVTHGGPIWHGTQDLLGVRDGVLAGVANCSITELDLEDDRFRLVAWNQVAHLPRVLRAGSGGDESRGADEDAPTTE